MDRKKKAYELFTGGCNCCQSTFVPYCDITGMDEQTALRLASSFGGGMAGLREVCGAVTGMFMVAGLKYGFADKVDGDTKKAYYENIRELSKRFEEKNGSIICRRLLGLEGKPADTPVPHGDASPCPGYVVSAIEILNEWLEEMEQKEKQKETV